MVSLDNAKVIGPKEESRASDPPEAHFRLLVSPASRWTVGALTVLPNLIFAYSLATDSVLPAVYGILSVLLITGIVLAHSLRNPALGSVARAGWGLSFVALGPIAVPAYWWRHIRRPLGGRTAASSHQGVVVSIPVL